MTPIVQPSPSILEAEDGKIYNSSLYLQAAERGDISLLEACTEAGIPLETKADDGSTALHCAARAGQTAAVQYLLGKGATSGHHCTRLY
jgi:ankyrin repeat protein